MSFKNLIIALALAACLFGIAGAQQQEPQSRSGITGLALEVTYFEGRPPAYQAVPWTTAAKGGSWYALFGRVAGWQLPAGAAPIDAVRIVPYLEGETVNVTVSVLRGLKFQDAEDQVATYVLRENEKLIVTPLKNFGVVPFELKVIRVGPQTTDLPTIVNKTRSVEVVGIEPLVSTFPRYKLTLHNLSDKNISALKVNIMREGKLKRSGMPQGQYGEPLIGAGVNYALHQNLSTTAQETPGGYTLASPNAQQIVIAALIFEDGTYEGDAVAAATYRGLAAGDRIELKRLVPLLNQTLATPNTVENFRKQLTGLNYDVDEADVVALAEAFPGHDRQELRTNIEVAVHFMRKQLLDELNSFAEKRHSDGDFQTWLTSLRDRYSNWLSRISSNKISQR